MVTAVAANAEGRQIRVGLFHDVGVGPRLQLAETLSKCKCGDMRLTLLDDTKSREALGKSQTSGLSQRIFDEN